MKRRLSTKLADSLGAGVEEHLEQVTADLPYELQSKMFDQLATVSIAGAGLSVTLIGSILQDAPPIVWLSVILFGLAAMFAISGNNQLIEGLMRKRPTFRRTKTYVGLATGLIGMAIGTLSMSIYYEGRNPVEATSDEAQQDQRN